MSAARHTLSDLRYLQFLRIRGRLRKHTMIPPFTYAANLALVTQLDLTPGAVVECGTWKGGMIAGIAKLLGNGRRYFLFDSFEGLPDAEAIDGASAREWQEDTTSPHYFDNCTASEEDAAAAMALAGIPSPTIVKGWFENTLPDARFPDGISILRMDGDWYSSTMQILDSLFPSVNVGGLILIDDYYTWDGCSKAVHDYFSKHQRPERINCFRGVCYVVKSAAGPEVADEAANAEPPERAQSDTVPVDSNY